MKILKVVLKAMNYHGHISLRRKIFHGTEYIGSGNAERIIEKFGGYQVECMEIIDNVLIIYVN